MKQRILEAVAPNQREHLPFLTKINKSTKNIMELLEGPKFVKAYNDQKGDSDPICAYERKALPENPGNNFFLLEVSMHQPRRQYIFSSSLQPVGQSRLFIMDKRKTLRELKIEIFKYFRPLIPGCKVDIMKSSSEENNILAEYKHYFESGRPNELYTI